MGERKYRIGAGTGYFYDNSIDISSCYMLNVTVTYQSKAKGCYTRPFGHTPLQKEGLPLMCRSRSAPLAAASPMPRPAGLAQGAFECSIGVLCLSSMAADQIPTLKKAPHMHRSRSVRQAAS